MESSNRKLNHDELPDDTFSLLLPPRPDDGKQFSWVGWWDHRMQTRSQSTWRKKAKIRTNNHTKNLFFWQKESYLGACSTRTIYPHFGPERIANLQLVKKHHKQLFCRPFFKKSAYFLKISLCSSIQALSVKCK